MASVLQLIPEPILVALIAGVISLLSLINSKEQKVTEINQAWIDQLRADVALVIAHGNAIFNLFDNTTIAQEESLPMDKMWHDGREDTLAMATAIARIRLRLTKTDVLSTAVLRSVDEFNAFFFAASARV